MDEDKSSIEDDLDFYIPDIPEKLHAHYIEMANEGNSNEFVVGKKLYNYVIEQLEAAKAFPIVIPLCLDPDGNIKYTLKSKAINYEICSVIRSKLLKAGYLIRVTERGPFIPNWHPSFIVDNRFSANLVQN
ncbi:MAG: hypothetical protein Hyperionvirus12_17 [Hyperionvirus sp.]|uniref:Uncharacterized protein n=1 Tax=Hyperionvirus sp. TaxID=2487770 RepID=A0A3G5A975_9VIRU|nr:MAG: hypothetical protein Hyperionvirus12_17 [Hyperionvirus sp.]